MKTEKQIQESIDKVVDSMEPNFYKALNLFNEGHYSECYDTLSTIMANVAALEAAQRILE